MDKPETVLVALLAGEEMYNASLVQMAHELPVVSADPSNRFRFGVDLIAGKKPQEYARNLACQHFLESSADTLLMIDHDMVQRGWPTLRLLDTPDYDIAGPVQLMFMAHDPAQGKEPNIYPCAFFFDEKGQMAPMWPLPGTTISSVDAVGSGCIAIKRRVIEDERMLLAPDMTPPAYWRNVFEANGNRTRGLDIDFCMRAKALGYRIKVNWSAEIGHFKRFDLNHAEMYAKRMFADGYAVGAKHALQVATGSCGPEPGLHGEPRFGERGDAEVASACVDRAV